MRYVFYTLIIGVAIGCLAMTIKNCNTAIVDEIGNTPIVGPVVRRIVKRMPKIVQPKPDERGGSNESVDNNSDVRPSHFMVNPRFDVGVGMGTTVHPSKNDLIPKVGVGVSIASYGKSKMDTKLRLLRVGVQTNLKEVEVTLAPVMVRLGNEKHPLFSGTYIYPYVGYSITQRAPSVGIGISVSF